MMLLTDTEFLGLDPSGTTATLMQVIPHFVLLLLSKTQPMSWKEVKGMKLHRLNESTL